MRISLRDVWATAVTTAVAAAYVGLVQGASWAPLTSVRWFALVFLLVGQTTSTIGAADALRDRTSRGAGFVLGPIALVATLAAIITGNEGVLGVAVLAMVVLWVLTTSRHALHGHRPVQR